VTSDRHTTGEKSTVICAAVCAIWALVNHTAGCKVWQLAAAASCTRVNHHILFAFELLHAIVIVQY